MNRSLFGRRNAKLAAIVAMTGLGAALHEGFFLWVGVVSLALVLVLRVQHHLPGSPLLSSFLILAVAGLTFLAVALYVVVVAFSPPAVIAALLLLVPASYFLVIAAGVGYVVVTGRRPPWADTVERSFGRLNRRMTQPIGRR